MLNRIIEYLYIYIFARPSNTRWNEIILNLALHARGYQNCCDSNKTGELKFIKFLKNYNIEVVLDIGANVGNYSSLVIEELNCTVFAFEPLPSTFKILSEKVSKYKNQLFCFNYGLGETFGNLKLYYGNNSEVASFLSSNTNLDFIQENNINEISVEVHKLDEVIFNIGNKISQIDLIKIDVEGFEYSVLLGALNTIEIYRPKFIQLEHNRYQIFTGDSMYKFSRLLPEYDLFQILPYKNGLVRREANDPLTNYFEYSNFCFVRKDLDLSKI